MEVARSHLAAAGYAVRDVSRERPYDLEASKDGEMVIVEVKGTTAEAGAILLTANEVHAHRVKHPHNALVVVSNIKLVRREDGPPMGIRRRG